MKPHLNWNTPFGDSEVPGSVFHRSSRSETGLRCPTIVRQGLRIQENPLLLVDWGANTNGNYKSDLTRTLFTGKPTRKHEKVYNVVLEAQRASIDAIRPGAICQDVSTPSRET